MLVFGPDRTKSEIIIVFGKNYVRLEVLENAALVNRIDGMSGLVLGMLFGVKRAPLCGGNMNCNGA